MNSRLHEKQLISYTTVSTALDPSGCDVPPLFRESDGFHRRQASSKHEEARSCKCDAAMTAMGMQHDAVASRNDRRHGADKAEHVRELWAATLLPSELEHTNCRANTKPTTISATTLRAALHTNQRQKHGTHRPPS